MSTEWKNTVKNENFNNLMMPEDLTRKMIKIHKQKNKYFGYMSYVK